MLPSLLARQVRTSVEDLLRASFVPSTPAFRDVIDRFIEGPGNLVKGPWLGLDMPFRRSESAQEFFPAVPLGFRPYLHQERAFDRLGGTRPRSTLMATGTGSGKTESFLWPILDACRRAVGEPGIKAILIYPMNALATDQARRIAKAVYRIPSLKGVRAGIYADERPVHPTNEMAAAEVITSRDEIIRNPPDILITNYKMLDYMLVRPDERELWSRNRAETLRFLVVDELHTFDGAQGTDLACLIRRIKARLGMKRGNLCCIGTSATLGGSDGSSDLLAYATKIFDEDFDADAVITEDRQSVREYVGDRPIDFLHIPSRLDALALLEALETSSPDTLIETLYSSWFQTTPTADVNDPIWRVALGDELDRHLFLQTLLRVLEGRPASYDEIREGLRARSHFRALSNEHLDALIDGMAALVAHARRVDPDLKDGAGEPVLFPFFSVRHQLWLRELRRMVAFVAEEPELHHHVDLREEEQRRALPVIYCRSCGGAGWVTVTPHDQRRGFGAEPKDIYEAYFTYSDRLRFLLREPPTPRVRRAIVGQTKQQFDG